MQAGNVLGVKGSPAQMGQVGRRGKVGRAAVVVVAGVPAGAGRQGKRCLARHVSNGKGQKWGQEEGVCLHSFCGEARQVVVVVVREGEVGVGEVGPAEPVPSPCPVLVFSSRLIPSHCPIKCLPNCHWVGRSECFSCPQTTNAKDRGRHEACKKYRREEGRHTYPRAEKRESQSKPIL